MPHTKADMMAETAETVETGLSSALTNSMQTHADNLLHIEDTASARTTERWEQMQVNAQETLTVLRQHQGELTKYGEVSLKVLQATGEITNLEKALNENLRALAGSKNFEDTVMSLSAAIQLLSSRLGKPLPRENQVNLDSADQERAA